MARNGVGEQHAVLDDADAAVLLDDEEAVRIEPRRGEEDRRLEARRATRTEWMAVPPVAGTPAQSADVFSSWQVAEQPSPASVPPSSHSSVPLAMPSPQTGGVQFAGAVRVLGLHLPGLVFGELQPKLPQYTSLPTLKADGDGGSAAA